LPLEIHAARGLPAILSGSGLGYDADVRARPVGGYAARIDRWIAAAPSSVARTAARARALATQPAAESAGPGLERSYGTLQARDEKLEHGQSRDSATPGALREMDPLRRRADSSRRFDVLDRLQHEGETLLQSTRTESDALARLVEGTAA
jgi:hypothetical protein